MAQPQQCRLGGEATDFKAHPLNEALGMYVCCILTNSPNACCRTEEVESLRAQLLQLQSRTSSSPHVTVLSPPRVSEAEMLVFL